MRRIAILSLSALVAGAATPRLAVAQRWNDERVTALVQLATARRARQLADTALVDYHATAHGYLTFLAQLGEGFPEPPKIVKADELALDVFWRAPNLSKQRIAGRRDTLLLPTDINYHRDHLGIVQNNFPSAIRLGDGDEVLDVPHPLSADGLREYDFAVSDSLRVALPGHTIDVIEVRVRPKDDTKPRAIGAVYIEKDEGQVVRMAFSFTRAALRDKELEDVSVVLENSLVEARFWLPRRQEIEIRRTGSWLDYPARGIIRGRWEICCYEVNRGISPAFFVGPEIVQAPFAEQAHYPWTGRVLDSLPPDVRAVTDEDVRAVQEQARALVRGQALARSRTSALSLHGISDFVRVDRAEGLAAGAAFTHRFGGGMSATVGGRYGIDDKQGKGIASLGYQRASGAGLRVDAYRDYRDASDEPERSPIVNSIAAQEFGSDYTEPYDARGAGLRFDAGTLLGLRWRLTSGYEWQRGVAVHARPAAGRYERTIPAVEQQGPRIALDLLRPTALAPLGVELSARAELRAARYRSSVDGASGMQHDVARMSAGASAERPSSAGRLVLRATTAAAAGPLVAPQDLVYLGGPVTGPGYDFHEFAARAGASAHLEWQRSMKFVSIPLGRFDPTGRSTASATLAPFAHVVYVDRSAPFQATRQGWYPSVGLGALSFMDLLRLDVARGLRAGRWTFSIDVGRAFWSVL